MRKVCRRWDIHLANNEWGNELMRAIAEERFALDETLDVVCVHEHAGWALAWNRAMQCVSSANDMAVFPKSVQEWRNGYDETALVGYCRRENGFEHRFDCYYPCVRREVADVA